MRAIPVLLYALERDGTGGISVYLETEGRVSNGTGPRSQALLGNALSEALLRESIARSADAATELIAARSRASEGCVPKETLGTRSSIFTRRWPPRHTSTLAFPAVREPSSKNDFDFGQVLSENRRSLTACAALWQRRLVGRGKSKVENSGIGRVNVHAARPPVQPARCAVRCGTSGRW